jgi:hypothetical protein
VSMTPAQVESEAAVDHQPPATSDDAARQVIFEWRRDDHRVR